LLLSDGQVYHPNIDLEGNICLNILREDWKPVLSINSVLYGLSFLFMVLLKDPYLLNFSPDCSMSSNSRVLSGTLLSCCR